MNGSMSVHFLLASEHEMCTHRLHFKKLQFKLLCTYILHVTRYSKNGNSFGEDKGSVKRERKHLEEEKDNYVL